MKAIFITVKEFKSNKDTTQGDLISMTIYSMGVIPLINMLIDIVVTSMESYNPGQNLLIRKLKIQEIQEMNFVSTALSKIAGY